MPSRIPSKRIVVGDEGRRSGYRSSKQQQKRSPHGAHHGGGGSSVSTSSSNYFKGHIYKQHDAPPKQTESSPLYWILKQLSPGLLMIACFFTFRNLSRSTQLILMGYNIDGGGGVVGSPTGPVKSAVAKNLRSSIGGGNSTRWKHKPSAASRTIPSSLKFLADLSTPLQPKFDVAYFWDIHFAGESVAESVFSKCHFLTRACEHGLKQPDYNDEALAVFEDPNGAVFVNVDLSTKHGIRRAKNLELTKSRIADIVESPLLHLSSESIFNTIQKGRMFTILRNPIHRAVSMYMYLSTASWDPHYAPELSQMTLIEYAQSKSAEHNWVTRFLVNKPGGKLDAIDLLTAKQILRQKCLIGIYEEMDDSLQRFTKYFSWKESDESTKCRKAVLETGDRRHNVPELADDEYAALANINKYDLELYEYAKVLYQAQGEQIFGIKPSSS